MRNIELNGGAPIDPNGEELREIKAHVKTLEQAGLKLEEDVKREFGVLLAENAKLAKIIRDAYPYVQLSGSDGGLDLMKRIQEVVEL